MASQDLMVNIDIWHGMVDCLRKTLNQAANMPAADYHYGPEAALPPPVCCTTLTPRFWRSFKGQWRQSNFPFSHLPRLLAFRHRFPVMAYAIIHHVV